MHIQPFKHLVLIFLLLVGVGSLGCANMTTTERRVASGAGIGAATGAVISGKVGRAAAAGALIGAGAGWLYDREKKKRYYYDRHGRRVYER